MTPIGHASISVLIGNRMKKKYFWVLLTGSLIPDIDFILMPLKTYNAIHRHFTHNLFFIFFVGIVMLIVIRSADYKMLLLFLAGGVMHLLIDSILDANPSNGTGVPLFWPVSDFYYSPFNLFKNYKIRYTWDQPLKFLFSLWKLYLIELLFSGCAILVCLKRNKEVEVGFNN